jgi:hypothetical protein
MPMDNEARTVAVAALEADVSCICEELGGY